MQRKLELGFGRCGLACFLCSENENCTGCEAGGCPGAATCENRRCSLEKGIAGCWACPEESCTKGLLRKIKPRVFCRYLRLHGSSALQDHLMRNAESGVVYHRTGVIGDYDAFTDEAALLRFIDGQK